MYNTMGRQRLINWEAEKSRLDFFLVSSLEIPVEKLHVLSCHLHARTKIVILLIKQAALGFGE